MSHNIPIGALVEVIDLDPGFDGLRLFVVDRYVDDSNREVYSLSFDRGFATFLATKELHPDENSHKEEDIFLRGLRRGRADIGYEEKNLKVIRQK